MLFQCAFLLLKFPKRLAVYVFLSTRKVDLSCLLSIAYKNGTKTSLVFLKIKCIIIICNPNIKKLLKRSRRKAIFFLVFLFNLRKEKLMIFYYLAIGGLFLIVLTFCITLIIISNRFCREIDRLLIKLSDERRKLNKDGK